MAYSNKKREQRKVDVALSPDILDLMIRFTLSSSPLVNLKSLVNLKKLVDRANFDDDYRDNRICFEVLKILLDQEVNQHNFQYNILKMECIKAFQEEAENIESLLEDALNYPITESEICYLNEYVEKKLIYFYIFENRDKLQQSLNLLEDTDDVELVNTTLEPIIFNLYKDIQNSKAVKKDSATDFAIGGSVTNKDKNLAGMVKKTIDDLNKPSNHIKTGVKSLNDMLGGGWENGRCYVAYAPPKSWKSGFLLNTGIWACRYNEFKTKDPDKTPCVLYVTMENTSKETLSRLYQHITNKKINTVSMQEACETISKYITNDNTTQNSFEIKYRKNKSLCVNDVDGMIEELALEGKEVVMIVIDYLKRIRSNENNPDPRIELGDATNDIVSMARERDIPAITAMQINRVGMAKIEAAVASKKGNLAKQFDKTDGGESALILENTDFAFSLYPEGDPTTNEQYLGMKSWVSRVEIDKSKEFFLQPFENGMKLVEDYGSNVDRSISSMTSKDEFNPNTVIQNASAARNRYNCVNTPSSLDGEITV